MNIHIHWLKNHRTDFVDVVSGKTVYNAKCRCGKHFLVDTLFPISFFKVETGVELTPLARKETIN